MARISFILILGFASTLIAQEKDGVVEKEFSGPQVGESLPALVTTGVFDDLAGKPRDLIKQGDGKTAIIIFVHQFTRPTEQEVTGSNPVGCTSFCATKLEANRSTAQTTPFG